MKRGLLTAAALLAIAGAASAQETVDFLPLFGNAPWSTGGNVGTGTSSTRAITTTTASYTFLNSFLWDGTVTVSGTLTNPMGGTYRTEAQIAVFTPSNGNGDIQPFNTGTTWTGSISNTRTQSITGMTGLPFNPQGQTFNFSFFESYNDGGGATNDADWSALSVTFNVFTPPTPPAGAVDLGTLAPGGMLMAQNPYVANTAQWYKFTLGTAIPASEAFIAHTFGNTLTGGQFGAGDTEIGLYDSLGNLIASNDDAAFPQVWSRINQGGGLAAGDYYIAAAAYNTTFSSGFNVTVSDAGTPTGDIKLTIIPTPGAMALLGLGGLLATRRRRA